MLLSWMNKGPVFAPDGDGSVAITATTDPVVTDPAAAPAPDAQSVLYPETDPAKPADAPAGETPPVDGWKEYEPDAAKSDAENATAKAEHDKTKPAEGDPLDAVPADGVYALTLPDGLEADTAMLEAMAPAMKEAGITVKQANALAAALTAHQKAEFDKFGATVKDWETSAKADAEIGGPNWNASVANARKVIGSYGTPELKQFLNETGAGNHPEVIRIMAKVGALIGEDKPTGGNQGGQARDAVSVLYPEDKPKG